MKSQITIGTRSSRLALIQAESARELLSEKLPDLKWETVPLSSPGDRDKAADLMSASADFFTRDLDEALLDGTIDCAIHSAKDLPEILASGVDFFWLPNSADPRDVLVCRLRSEDTRSRIREARPTIVSGNPKVIGVSSERRIAYAKERFPDAECKPLRGTIEERIAQLDDGEFDCIIMAAAALQRLGLEERITEWIEDLPVPDGQGTLALTFRSDDERFIRLRSLFVKPVVFVSAGTSAELCTQAGVAALRRADICLYDALLDDALLAELSEDAQKIYVGKRSGEHSRPQEEICELLTRFARHGKRVVRLKGGDAGLYGRLAEEIDALDARQLSYRVIPGVSSLSSATTGTGLLLTRRGTADRAQILSGHPKVGCRTAYPYSGSGRCVSSRKKRFLNTGKRWLHYWTRYFSSEVVVESFDGETIAIFMGIQTLETTVLRLFDDGKSPELPVSVVFSAGRDDQQIISAPLSEIVSKVGPTDLPGLVLIGETANPKFLYPSHGALRGKRVWLTCSAAIHERAAQAVLDFGGVPIQQPLIELVPEKVPIFGTFDWLIVTSPSAVRCLVSQLDDLRSLPKILCCGTGTAKALNKFRIQADAMPEGEFNTKGVLEAAQKHISKDSRILRIRSDRAGKTLSDKLRETFDPVEDVVICRNEKVVCKMPECDAVFFASVSAVESFAEQFDVELLARKEVVVIGKMDAAALRKHGVENVVAPKQSTVEGAVEALATNAVWSAVIKVLKGSESRL